MENSAIRAHPISLWRDYASLAKPGAVIFHLATAATAMFLAAGRLTEIAIFTLVGGGLVAGAANALNCYFDRDMDAMMARTQYRPLPAGRMKASRALLFAAFAGVIGLYVLLRFVSPGVAGLAAGALVYYLVYTMWLKRRTRWSTLLASGAGAFPPLIGWVAVTGHVEAAPFVLFAIISLWTAPHFLGLAVSRRRDYALAGVRVLPVQNVARLVLICCLLLIAATLLLVPAAGLGRLYAVMALIFGNGMWYFAAKMRSGSAAAAHALFIFSLVYLPCLFAAMLADRLLTG